MTLPFVTLKNSSRRRNAGFTLVELVVATGITLVLATMLIGVTSSILSAWNRSRGKLMSSNQAKLALDQLADDLAGAFYRPDGKTWLAATVLESNNSLASVSNSTLASDRDWIVSGSNSLAIKPRTADVTGGTRTFQLEKEDIGECRFGMAGVWLRFFTTKQDENAGSPPEMSAPTAVSYQVVRRRVGSTSSECAYILHRSVVSPAGTNSTFSTGYDLMASAYNTENSAEGNPGNVLAPPKSHAIANHVIDFGVRLYVREAVALRLIFPAEESALGVAPFWGTPSDDVPVPAAELAHLSRATTVVAGDAYRNRFPDVVEVSLRVLSDEGARLIQNLEAGKITGNWWDIADANSSVYTRKIEVKGRGL